jgi:hypothetical protein
MHVDGLNPQLVNQDLSAALGLNPTTFVERGIPSTCEFRGFIEEGVLALG